MNAYLCKFNLKIQIKMTLHFYINQPFSCTKAKMRHFGGNVCPREIF